MGYKHSYLFCNRSFNDKVNVTKLQQNIGLKVEIVRISTFLVKKYYLQTFFSI